MRIQHVIHLDIDRGVLHTWHDGSYMPVASYSPGSSEPSALLSFLRQNSSGTIGIIVDVLEEEHSRDRIARLRQRDQKAVLERKLARTFPRTEFSTATLQGRSADKTQGKDVLFSALTTPDHVRTLVEQLAAAFRRREPERGGAVGGVGHGPPVRVADQCSWTITERATVPACMSANASLT